MSCCLLVLKNSQKGIYSDFSTDFLVEKLLYIGYLTMHPYLLNNCFVNSAFKLFILCLDFSTVFWHKPLNFKDEYTVLCGYFQVCTRTAYSL